MKNCLDCYRCWVVKDPDPKDDTCLAAFCSKSKTRGMKCNEISYLMPLGYNSAFAESPQPGDPWIAIAEHWDSLRGNVIFQIGVRVWKKMENTVYSPIEHRLIL